MPANYALKFADLAAAQQNMLIQNYTTQSTPALDLRHRQIENIREFMILIDRERQQGPAVTNAIITFEQAEALQADLNITLQPASPAGIPSQIDGIKLEIKPQ